MATVCHIVSDCQEENGWICDECNKLYCILCFTSQSNGRCKECIMQLTYKHLRTSIKTANIFDDAKIIDLLAEYSMGIILNCCNKQCENEINLC